MVMMMTMTTIRMKNTGCNFSDDHFMVLFSFWVLLEIRCSADINAQNSGSGWTGLHCAAFQGHGPVILVLMQYQPDLTLKDDQGRWVVYQLSHLFRMSNIKEWLYTRTKFAFICQLTPKLTQLVSRYLVLSRIYEHSNSSATRQLQFDEFFLQLRITPWSSIRVNYEPHTEKKRSVFSLALWNIRPE